MMERTAVTDRSGGSPRFLPSVKSLPQSPLHRSPYSSPRNQSTSRFAEEERMVAGLADWRKEAVRSEAVDKIKFAELALMTRKHKSEVAKAVLERRSKKMLPKAIAVSDSSLVRAKELSLKRLVRKEEMDFLREKSMYAKRYEAELDKTISDLTSQLQSLVQAAEQCRSEASEHREALLSIYEDLKAAKRTVQPADTKRRSSRPEEAAKLRSQHQAALFIKEFESHEKEHHSKTRITELRRTAETLDLQTAQVRKELEEVYNSLQTHYRRVLSEGKDTRGEGLVWVVRKLWQTGIHLTVDMFPPFLDAESVQTVLFLAQKSCEIDELSSLLQATKPEMSTSLLSSQRWNNITERLQALTAAHHSSAVERKAPVVSPTRKLAEAQLSDLSVIESRIREVKSLLISTKEAEVRRLTSECFLNNYEKQFRTSLRTVVSALVGVEALDRYVPAINKEQKNLMEQLAHTKTFSFVSRAT